MNIYVNGSLAYDRLMSFQGKFSEHILSDQLHNINVSFTMEAMQEFFGGTAGNIAYGLAQLQERPIVLGNLGRDGAFYLEYLKALNVDTSWISILNEEFTAGAYITTDLDNNQITSFYAGAMRFPSRWRVEDMDPDNTLVIVSPGNLRDMQMLPEALRSKKVPFVFDPGQSLPAWRADELGQAVSQAALLICNEYELELICQLLKTTPSELSRRARSMVVTKGQDGSILYADGQRWHIGIIAVENVVDPTGAGDAYRAGLLQALANGQSMLNACRQGGAMAALAIGVKGTQGYSVAPEGLDLASITVTHLEG